MIFLSDWFELYDMELLRLVYENCCVLTTWKFIDFHLNPSLATNGNEQFVWVNLFCMPRIGVFVSRVVGSAGDQCPSGLISCPSCVKPWSGLHHGPVHCIILNLCERWGPYLFCKCANGDLTLQN